MLSYSGRHRRFDHHVWAFDEETQQKGKEDEFVSVFDVDFGFDAPGDTDGQDGAQQHQAANNVAAFLWASGPVENFTLDANF